MTARKHHPKLIIFDQMRRKEFVKVRREFRLILYEPRELRCEGSCCAIAPEHVERAILCGRHQPGGGVFGDTSVFPQFQRAAEGVLDNVFCHREVLDSENAGECRDHAPRLTPEKVIRILHHISTFMTGRTSTEPPTSRIGQPFEISNACARSFASINIYPPTISLASAYGPSTIVLSLPVTILPVRSSGRP